MSRILSLAALVLALTVGLASRAADEKKGAAPGERQVVATGVGTTEDEAKKNALQNAVEQAVGVLVDAKTLVENDKLVAEKILTFSNGYVERYRTLSTQKVDGLVQVKVLADVKIEKLAEKLQALSVTTRQAVDGASLAAEAKTKTKRDGDARAMIAEAGKGFPVSCLTTKVGKMAVKARKDGDVVELAVPVSITVDADKYKDFDATFRKAIAAAAKRSKKYAFAPYNLAGKKNILQAPGGVNYGFHAGLAVPGGIPLYFLPGIDIQQMHYGVPSWDKEKTTEKFKQMGTFGVMLYDSAEKGMRRMSWTFYELDETLLPLFDTSPQATVQIGVRLLDKDGKTLAERARSGLFPGDDYRRLDPHDLKPEAGSLLGIGETTEKLKQVTVNVNLVTPGAFINNYRGPKPHLRVFPVGPFYYYYFQDPHAGGGAGGFSTEVRFAMPFEVSNDELEKVRSVECTLSSDDGETIFRERENPRSKK